MTDGINRDKAERGTIPDASVSRSASAASRTDTPADTSQGTGESVKTRIRNKVQKHREKPLRRGFMGYFFYHLGMFLTGLGVRIETRGLENLPDDLPYILAANHETYVDGMWILSCLPKQLFKRFTCIGAQDLLTRYGPFGRIIMHVGRAIPINRFGNPIRALGAAQEALEQGNVLLIHPEGTRSRNGKLGRIQEGACFISKKSSAPVIPVFLDGAYEIFNRYMRFPSFRDKKTGGRHRLIIRFGKPLYPADYKNIKSMNAALTEWFHDAFAHKEIPREYDPDLLREKD